MMTRMVKGKWVNGFADLLWKLAARQLTGGLVHARRLATLIETSSSSSSYVLK